MTHYVFVHGAMHGSWCWEPLLEPLKAQGHHSYLVDLPGRPGGPGTAPSLESYVETVVSAVRDVAEPVVLVAHSLGGVPSSLALQYVHQHVQHAVFVNAALVADGRSALENVQALGTGCFLLGTAGAVEFDGDFIKLGSTRAAIEGFYNQTPADVAAKASTRLCPEPIAPMMSPVCLDISTFDAVPRTYLGARRDKMLTWEFQQDVAREFHADFVELAGDHSPFFSATDDVVAHLSKL